MPNNLVLPQPTGPSNQNTTTVSYNPTSIANTAPVPVQKAPRTATDQAKMQEAIKRQQSQKPSKKETPKSLKGPVVVMISIAVIVLAILGIFTKGFGYFNSPRQDPTLTPIPTPLFINGQLPNDGQIPLEGFGVAATPTAGIPISGFLPTKAPAAPKNSQKDVITLNFPGGPGLYDYIWKRIEGYTLGDAADPNGSFVCMYKTEVRATGIEGQWKDAFKKGLVIPITIKINQKTINGCGGAR